jgi:hypothetical protein
MGIVGEGQEFFMVPTYMALVNDSDSRSFNNGICDWSFAKYYCICIHISRLSQ